MRSIDDRFVHVWYLLAPDNSSPIKKLNYHFHYSHLTSTSSSLHQRIFNAASTHRHHQRENSITYQKWLFIIRQRCVIQYHCNPTNALCIHIKMIIAYQRPLIMHQRTKCPPIRFSCIFHADQNETHRSFDTPLLCTAFNIQAREFIKCSPSLSQPLPSNFSLPEQPIIAAAASKKEKKTNPNSSHYTLSLAAHRIASIRKNLFRQSLPYNSADT